jgi:hypothetical protein
VLPRVRPDLATPRGAWALRDVLQAAADEGQVGAFEEAENAEGESLMTPLIVSALFFFVLTFGLFFVEVRE